ncbi:relaxase/mobilization nuclease domain-containing protein [uncultured Campylobacter sp.]|uniref:relaxase/mobilization nuclease domain-containing protein n=1 Tax=uncultured Campylobacter sp. TaxID=218934 RepID=UPI00261AA18B|nr:relaxase/mobilization nuclease domain-containing protein [uncultured Campylobacter sp.]
MLVKFFKNKNGGSVAGINYLLNHRVKDKTAFVLKGSEAVTRQIVSNMTKKQKLCMGCLSFEETDIDLDTKRKIIDEFETLLLGGYKERFNVLWVQHVDKGRLELNFAIPKIDIESSMAFNPYYDKVDRPLIDTWQNYVNLKFGFTDPKDPAKAHMLQGSKKELKLIKDYIELEKILTEKFINQEFTCRDDILNALKSSDIDITRIGKDYISVKLPNTKKAKRFKGDMFSEEFGNIKSMEQLRGKTETRATEFRNRADEQTNIDASERSFIFADYLKSKESRDFRIIKFKQNLSKRDQELARLKRELDKQIQKRTKWLETQVGRVPKRSRYIQNTIGDLDDSSDLGIDICMDAISTKERFNPRKSDYEDVYKAEYGWRAINHKYTIFNERIFDNDFTRANIIGSIRRKREARARSDGIIKAAIDGIRLVKQRISQVANAINKQYKLFISRIRECTNTINKLTEGIRKSDIFAREIPDAAREFEEVARRYVLSRIPEDTKIDVSKIKRKEIRGVGVGGDMEIG